MALSLRLSLLCAILNSASCFAATYYLSASGNDSNSCASAQSSGAPKKSFSSAWGCLSAGDTLIVQNGTYGTASPPKGKAGTANSPITIQAASDGQAVISSEVMNFRSNSYINFIGFKISGGGSAIDVASDGSSNVSHHLTFQRIGFTCTSTSNDNACVSLHDGTHDVLIEDSWVWGGGRYSVMCYGGPNGNSNTTCDHNTFRRMVIRQGPNTSSSGNPQAGLSLYYASNNLVENVIVIDSQPASDSDNAAFYLTDHGPPPPVTYNKFFGVVALNNLGTGWYISGAAGHSEVHESVFWGSGQDGMAQYETDPNACGNNLFDHVTSGAHKGSGIYNLCSSLTVTSTMMINNAQYGGRQYSNGSIASADYNEYYNNSSGARSSGFTAGTHDHSSSPGLLYLLRTEPGTVCSGGGAGGTNCGATIVNRYKDGTLTQTALWPWPNEARIKKEMCTDAGVTRGFCSKNSLTEYIWTYLGNPVPSSYGGGGTAASPCDLNGDGVVTSADIDLAQKQAVGAVGCTNSDLNSSGSCNVVDVQRVINASLGKGCRTGQ